MKRIDRVKRVGLRKDNGNGGWVGGKPKAAKAFLAKADTTTRKEPAPEFDFGILRQLRARHALANINSVEGTHNIYFLFKNNAAKAKEPLMQVPEIHFNNAVSSA